MVDLLTFLWHFWITDDVKTFFFSSTVLFRILLANLLECIVMKIFRLNHGSYGQGKSGKVRENY